MSRPLSEILGHTYGGPSISYEDGKFVLYTWGDSPVGMDIHLSHPDWKVFIEMVMDYRFPGDPL